MKSLASEPGPLQSFEIFIYALRYLANTTYAPAAGAPAHL